MNGQRRVNEPASFSYEAITFTLGYGVCLMTNLSHNRPKPSTGTPENKLRQDENERSERCFQSRSESNYTEEIK